MIIETFVICSLIYAAPGFDCSEEWTINIYDFDKVTQYDYCAEWGLVGEIDCANWDTNEIYVNQYTMNMPDSYGIFNSSIRHELEHLKCECNFH